eukprot:1150088-Pelagomonas_calceolata.AAC.4
MWDGTVRMLTIDLCYSLVFKHARHQLCGNALQAQMHAVLNSVTTPSPQLQAQVGLHYLTSSRQQAFSQVYLEHTKSKVWHEESVAEASLHQQTRTYPKYHGCDSLCSIIPTHHLQRVPYARQLCTTGNEVSNVLARQSHVHEL